MGEKTYQLSQQAYQQETTLTKEERKSGLGETIRKAVQAADPNAYNAYHTMLESAENGQIPLNSSLGSQQAAKGRVISFNVAGSGFSEPLRYELGLAGKANVNMSTEKDRAKAKPGAKAKHYEKGKKGEVYTYVKPDGTKLDIPGDQVEAFCENWVDETFGKGGILGMKHIRKKESADQRKTKYSISGPTPAGGMFNAGDYTIQDTRQYIRQLGAEHLDALKNDKAFMASGEHIYLDFTGHSRGGVGAVEGACMLKGLINEKYPELKDRVHFSVLLYDPVPGPKNVIPTNVNHGINLKDMTAEMKELGMAPLDENDHSTVVYSMGCNHDHIDFSPQRVLGADTIILTGHDHKQGLKDVEEQFGITKRKAYINSDNGQAYRASGLADMPKGVYISDENNIMVKAKDMDTVEKVIDTVYQRSDKPGNRRIRRIVEACNDVTVRAGGAPSYASIIRGFNAHDSRFIRSSAEFKAMRRSFEQLEAMQKQGASADAVSEKKQELRQNALKYIAVKNSKNANSKKDLRSNLAMNRMNLAKNIVQFLDSDMEPNAMGQELDPAEKTNDMRAAYLDQTKARLQQNANFMKDICRDYQNGGMVPSDLMGQVVTSMVVDRYFLQHADQFMPDPLTDTQEHPEKLKQLDEVLGSDKKSLYEAFSKSQLLNNFIKDLQTDSAKLTTFENQLGTDMVLDQIGHHIVREITQIKENPANARQMQQPAVNKAPAGPVIE